MALREFFDWLRQFFVSARDNNSAGTVDATELGESVSQTTNANDSGESVVQDTSANPQSTPPVATGQMGYESPAVETPHHSEANSGSGLAVNPQDSSTNTNDGNTTNSGIGNPSEAASTSPNNTVPADTTASSPINSVSSPLDNPPINTTSAPAPIISDETLYNESSRGAELTVIQNDSLSARLNGNIEFRAITNPPKNYSGCELDLSQASGVGVISPLNNESGVFTLRFSQRSMSANDTQRIIVRNPQGEISIELTVSLMKAVWHNHVGREYICDQMHFPNQCAIRMGAALELSGVKLPTSRRILRRCTTEYRAFKDHKHGDVKGHVLAAQELANWIKSQPATFGTRHIVSNKSDIIGRPGLIFIRNGWDSTDHIDVWDGESLAGGFPSYFDVDYDDLWFWDVH